ALRLHVCGFSQAVASLGTSLTAQQAALLKRFADRCYICYDTDAAGQAASLRGMYILAENGLDVRVITLPQGKDPDEFLSSNSPAEFQSAIDTSLSLIEYHIAILRPSLSDPSDPLKLKRKQAVSELWDGVKRIGTDEALRYSASLASAFELPVGEVKSRLLGAGNTRKGTAGSSFPTQKDIDKGLEYGLCALLSEHRECRLSVKLEELAALLTDGEARLVAEAMIEGEPEELMDLWRAIGDVSKVSIVMKGEIFLATLGGTWREKWDKVHSGLEALRIRRRLGEIEAKLFVNSATEGESLEFMELRQKLAGLKI
ncbi:MAG: toprim domain-containing protein, partial [Synergistaceae bacterium]|nr:toprim domain-containing protein [Synergistaceae bacterium]